MTIYTTHTCPSCVKSNPNDDVGFRIITLNRGDNYAKEDKTYYNLIFMLEGEIELSRTGTLSRQLRKHELFLIPPRTCINMITSTGARLLILASDHKIEAACEGCFSCDYCYQKIVEEYVPHTLWMTPQLVSFSELIEQYIMSQAQCYFLDSLKVKELFAILPRNYSSKELSYFFYPVATNRLTFRTRVIEASQAGLSIHEIAGKIGMSPRTFSRRFSDEFGEPARFWLLKEKAKIIKNRMLMSEVTIADIIAEYNFTDMSHFTKFCKEYYQCTPRELLKIHKLKSL